MEDRFHHSPRAGHEGGPAGVFASDGATAWVVSFTTHGLWTYRTTDNGVHWKEWHQRFAGENISNGIEQMVFSDPNHGWVLVLGGAGMGSAGHEILRTSDGGKTWARVEYATMTGKSSPHALPLCNGAVSTISFVGPEIGWVTGICGAISNSKEVFQSTDGGHKWHRAHVSAPVKNLKYFSAGQVVDVSQTVRQPPSELMPVAVANPSEFLLYHSGDAGLHWTPTSAVKEAGSGIGPSFLYAPYSASTSWVLLGSYVKDKARPTLWRTINGGTSWSALAKPFAAGQILQLDFPTTNAGFAVASTGKVYVADDAGKNWKVDASTLSG
jgi:photosystem II stability/assembly factor-like uncharacterized protein